MAGQEPLFYEDWRGAFRQLVGALGGPKKAGAMLRPTLTPSAAANWVNDCLNPDRDTKFDFEDIETLLRKGRELHIHCAIWQLCDAVGYARPTIAPSKSPNQLRAERMERLLLEFKHLADEEAAEQSQGSQNLKAVR